jgi:hypothetical protein
VLAVKVREGGLAKKLLLAVNALVVATANTSTKTGLVVFIIMVVV